jgi:GT2 family glycosyltransferase
VAAKQDVSVVIITRNRCGELLRTLRELAQLPEQPPVIVVDNGSTDDTVRAVRDQHPQVQLTELGRNAGAAARNVGVQQAATPYVAFADDDSWWTPGSLTRAAELMAKHLRLALIGGLVLSGDTRVPEPTCLAMAESPLPAEPDLPGRPVLGFIACGAVVHRQRFLEVGGFHERYGVGGEELPLAIELAKAGWGLAYVPDVVALHYPSPARDRERRRAIVVRNDLWVAWGRRRAKIALMQTAAVMGRLRTDPAARRGLAMAAAGSFDVLRHRKPVPAWLENQLLMLDHKG